MGNFGGFLKYLHLIVMVWQLHMKGDKPEICLFTEQLKLPPASAFKIDEISVCIYFILLYALQRSTVRLSETLRNQGLWKIWTLIFIWATVQECIFKINMSGM